MRGLSLSVLGLVLLTGCSSVQEVGMAIEGDKPGDAPHYQVLRDKLSGRVFGQNLQVGKEYHCKHKFSSEEMAELRSKYGESSWYTGCTRMDTQVIAGQSTASQLQGPVAAALLGAGIGAGLAFSGDDVQNNNSSNGGAGGAGGQGGIGKGGAGGKGGNGGSVYLKKH